MSHSIRSALHQVLVLTVASLLVFAGCGPEDENNTGNNGANNGDECTPTNGGVEICDDIDNDCNGEVDDEPTDGMAYYTDGDDDGYGDPASEVLACEQPSDDVVTQGGDCDDSDPAINPDAMEVCDGVDNDCDDETDANGVEPQDCDNQTGVCAGSRTSTCESEEYAACTADDFGADYASRDDESLMCDGLDNDCDGDTDEFCCGVDVVPPSVGLATAVLPGTEHPFDADQPPAFAAASDANVVDAVIVGAWQTDTSEITLQHFDAFGTPVGDAEIVDSPDPVNSVAIVPRESDYELIWSTYAEESSGATTNFNTQLNAQGRNSDLSQDGFPEVVLTIEGNVSEAKAITELEAVAIDNTVAVGWVMYEEAGGSTLTRSAGGAIYPIDDRENGVMELDLASGDTDEAFSNVSTHVHDGDVLFAWGEPDQERLSVRVFATDGTAGATVDADLQGNLLDSRIDAVSLSANELLVFDSESGVSGPELVATTITLDTGDVSTDRLAVGQEPSIVGVDADGDGYADRVTALWQKLGGAGDNLFVRSIEVDALSPDTQAELALDYTFTATSPPAVFHHDVGIGLSWRAAGTSSREVFYLPFSTRGLGVCQP
jgi:hypothetical protein